MIVVDPIVFVRPVEETRDNITRYIEFLRFLSSKRSVQKEKLIFLKICVEAYLDTYGLPSYSQIRKYCQDINDSTVDPTDLINLYYRFMHSPIYLDDTILETVRSIIEVKQLLSVEPREIIQRHCNELRDPFGILLSSLAYLNHEDKQNIPLFSYPIENSSSVRVDAQIKIEYEDKNSIEEKTLETEIQLLTPPVIVDPPPIVDSSPKLSFNSWDDLLERIKVDYESSMIFSDEIIKNLQNEAFDSRIADNVYQRIGILDKMHKSLDNNNKRSAEGNELYRQYVAKKGDKAYFSDESDTNQSSFKTKLTFQHPITKEKVECFWHGKISQRKYRMYFPHLPRDRNERTFIAYIGPKITKK
ncbi:MAG: hypothetical protein AAF639_19375 [Chloroflexota bacterium]